MNQNSETEGGIMFRPITIILSIIFVVNTVYIRAQNTSVISGEDFIQVPAQLENKIGSGRLLVKLSEKNAAFKKGLLKKDLLTAKVVVYSQKYPTTQQIQELEQRGLTCYLQTWTPPMDNHPLGYFIAELPIDKLNDVLLLDFVKRLDTAEGASIPQNNNAAKSIKATAAWTKGWTGKGVKVGVLDSGIHADSLDPDLPATYEKKDYSLFPLIDDDVRNRITGHGTHVTGTILGRGILSNTNFANGGGPYKGMAPDASLAFFKIGDDTTAGASDAAIIAALNDAVTLYHVNVINMSYGGWGPYHDGSEPVDQKADWCFSQGVAISFAAGNSAQSRRHYMGTVPANGASDFIQVNVRNADSTKTRPSFNLLWFDGLGTRNNLTLKYYDEQKNEIINVNRAPTTESPRGTESQFSSTQQFTPQGNSTYFLKVVNASNADQVFHIYEDYTEWAYTAGSITFENPSSDYTLVSPSTADHVLSVGAYTSRSYWVSADGGSRRYYQTLDQIASFSSRGPRVDGRNKPDIAAPGTALISIRDRDVFKSIDGNCVDNDGVPSGDAKYYVMQGTSMAAPTLTGALAVLLSRYPSLPPQQLYDSLQQHALHDIFTSAAPNPTWGAGKLDLGFLTGVTSPAGQDGWVQVNPNGWANQGIPGIAVNAQGNVFVNVGKPWTTDTSTIYRSVDNGSTWTAVKSEPSLAPLAIQKSGTLLTAGRNQGFIYRSVNNGNTWTKIGTPHDYTSIAVRYDDSLIIGTYGQGIFYSVDDGLAWYELNNGLPANAQVPTVAAGGTYTYFALVMTNGIVRFYRYEGSIQKWILSDNGIDTTKNVNACAVMPDGTAFASVFDRIYRSTDDGKTWQQITILNDYLQYLYAYSNTTIFVGTVSGGVYRSTDKGNSWSSFSEGLTTLNIATMGSNKNGMMYAGADREKVFRRSIGTPPSKINLVEPANNAAAASIPTTFRWMNDNRAITYWLQVSTAQDFSTPLINQQDINQLEWQVNILQLSTRYFWRVCGANNAGAGVWSDTWSFMTAPPFPAVPVLRSPVNSSTNIPLNISFSWSVTKGPAWYHIQVSTDVTFTTTVYDQSNISNTYFTVTGLQNNATYYWRVSAVNIGGASAWSSIWSFTTILAMPTVPTLVSPISGMKDVAIPTTLVWNTSSGASSYTLQVGVDANFMPPLIFSQSGITDTSKIVSGLITNSTFYWRVNATNIAGTSAWSTAWSFTTISKTLAAPLLVTPIDGATGISKDTTLTWNAVSGATSYHLQVSLSSSFATPIIDQIGIITTSFAPTGLNYNTKHYWRVNATNIGGTSSWSNVWSFTTATQTSIRNEKIAESFQLEQNYPNPFRDRTVIGFQFTANESAFNNVTLKVFDLLGREVAILLDGNIESGNHEINFNADGLSNGIYYYRLTIGNYCATKILVVHK